MNVRKKLPYWLILGLIFLFCLVLSLNWLQLALVEGHSMEPAYRNGQLVLIDKTAREYLTGDVVLFYSRELNSFLIKRVAACPGDSLIIDGGQLYVNSKAVPGYENIADPGLAEKELVLPAETFFLLGDNLPLSVDSRDARIGPVSLSDIKGKLIQR